MKEHSALKNWLKYLLYTLFLGGLIFLTFNKHSRTGNYNYQSEIWADKAGYYVYLPATFKYNFNANAFPDSVDSKTGYGFILDPTDNKVKTKYTYGVSLLQAPFYLIADAIAKASGERADGFSPIYQSAMNIAAVFYLFFALVLLKKFLNAYHSATTAYTVALLLFFGTNLYHYTIDETGMSHVYSFFLFSALLYLFKRSNFLADRVPVSRLFLIGLIMGLIVLIRPINVLFLSCLLFLEIDSLKQFKLRLAQVFQWRKMAAIGLAAGLIIIPQLLYWNYLSGTALHYPYENEGFNFLNPQLIAIWFSPNNGLFLYTPLFILIIFSILFTFSKYKVLAWYQLILFLCLSYLLSSWWAWNFGCSFGSRSFIEYYAFFSIPLAIAFESILKRKRVFLYGFVLISAVSVYYNMSMTYVFDECFYGAHNWDWTTYLKLLHAIT